MINYFYLVPAAAVRRDFDGHLYAWIDACVTAQGVKQCEPRMLRADGCEISNGVARIWFGRMGDAIAQRLALPYSVEFEHTPDSDD